MSEQRPLKGYNCLSKVIALFSGRTRNKTQIFGISGDFRLERVSKKNSTCFKSQNSASLNIGHFSLMIGQFCVNGFVSAYMGHRRPLEDWIGIHRKEN